MASIINDPGGRKRIQFLDAAGKRKTIRLGRVEKRQAEAFRVKVEAIAFAVSNGHAPSQEIQTWVGALDVRIRRRLARAGLWEDAGREVRSLGKFLDAYFAAITVKPGTLTMYKQTKGNLLACFGEGFPVSTFGPREADRFVAFLRKQELADATVSRRVRVARQMFAVADRWGVVARNPFAHVKSPGESNKSREYFITRDVAAKVLDACPDAEWRLLFALSRYGGLRCPSEHLALRWSDVNFPEGRVTVRASKTERNADKGIRVIPLFDELRPYLEDAHQVAAPGTVYVINRYRKPSVNLRTQLMRILARAGVKPWPRLWQNLRATRQTELVERLPVHVACAFIGNTEKVARKHYLQIRDEYFDMMNGKAAQNAAQQAAESARIGSQVKTPTGAEANETAVSGREGDKSLSRPGLEHPGGSPNKTGPLEESGAESGARAAARMRRAQRILARAQRKVRQGTVTPRKWGEPC